MSTQDLWINEATIRKDPTVTRIEREYIEQLQKENEDPTQAHRTIIRCWDDEKKTYRPRWLYEINSNIFQMVLSEIGPIFARSERSPSCICVSQYYLLLRALNILKSATATYQFTSQTFQDLKGAVNQTILKKIKELKGQIFFTEQDAADAIESNLTEKQVMESGDTIMECLKTGGLDEETQKKRIAQIQSQFDEFHGHVPIKPNIPSDEPCPHCHLPYAYSWLELIPYESPALQRIVNGIIGAPVMFCDIPRVFEALELWFFASDSHLFIKKNMTDITMTSLLMNRFKKWIKETKQNLLEGFGESNGIEQPSTDSVSSPLDVPRPPPEAPTPEGS